GDIVLFDDKSFECDNTLSRAYKTFTHHESTSPWRGQVIFANGSFLRVDLGAGIKALINIGKGQVTLLCGK
ncbi:MAG: hypothetical protein MJZ20_07055, partial [Bacteroidaceae bacterium]|nr:hypothetical protein [Bacteroidaceae bacterium]